MATAPHQHLCGGPRQEILTRVGSVLGGDLGAARRNSAGSLGQGGGDPRSTRTFHYSGTQQGLTEAEHAIRERRRQGTLAFERRVDAVVSEVASGKRQDERWEQLERVDVGQAKDMLDRRNTLFHATENKQFVQMWRFSGRGASLSHSWLSLYFFRHTTYVTNRESPDPGSN